MQIHSIAACYSARIAVSISPFRLYYHQLIKGYQMIASNMHTVASWTIHF